MAARQSTRATRPASLSRPTRRPAGRHAGNLLYGPRRCPSCHVGLTHLPVVPQSALDLAEIVARATLQGDVVTSARLAELTGVSASECSERLKAATRDGILMRSQRDLPSGGRRYEYRIRPVAAAYVASATLATQIRDLFSAPGNVLARLSR